MAYQGVVISHIGLVRTILAMRQAGYSWNKIRKKIAPGVSKIVFWKIAHKSYEPKDPILRYKLGLPEVRLLAICPDCGKPKTKNHRCGIRRPPRISIRLDNPESAARSIEGHMEPDVIAELIELLKDGKT